MAQVAPAAWVLRCWWLCCLHMVLQTSDSANDTASAEEATQLAAVVFCNSQKLTSRSAGTRLLLHASQHLHKRIFDPAVSAHVLVKTWRCRCLSFVQNHTALKSVDSSSDRSERFACITL
jgi:hypothetical protein